LLAQAAYQENLIQLFLVRETGGVDRVDTPERLFRMLQVLGEEFSRMIAHPVIESVVADIGRHLRVSSKLIFPLLLKRHTQLGATHVERSFRCSWNGNHHEWNCKKHYRNPPHEWSTLPSRKTVLGSEARTCDRCSNCSRVHTSSTHRSCPYLFIPGEINPEPHPPFYHCLLYSWSALEKHRMSLRDLRRSFDTWVSKYILIVGAPSRELGNDCSFRPR